MFRSRVHSNSISVIIYLLFNLVFSPPCIQVFLVVISLVSLLLFAFLIVKEMGRLVTRQTILVLFILFGYLNLGACAGFALANCDWLGRTVAFYQVFFPAGEGGFGQMMYRSPERSPQDSRDGIFLYSAQASFSWSRVDLARLLRRAYSRSVWIISFEFVKVCGIRFSIWESFIGFYICCFPISTILACLLSAGVRISRKQLC